MSDFLDLVGMSSLKERGDPTPRRLEEELSWDPAQYLKFAGPRLQPALDLVARLASIAPRSIVDLGCGTGEITALLAERWPDARVTGIDNSADMLAKARSAALKERISWARTDIAKWQPDEPVDLIYSNAALHWLGDHGSLLPRLVGFLAEGGTLAIQMPHSWAQPSHRLMREVLEHGDEGSPIGPAQLRQRLARPPTLEPGNYLDILAVGGRHVEVWETEYMHLLEGEDPVLEWVKSTSLRPLLEGLAADDRERFLAIYRRRLCEAYPPRPDGTTLFRFRRIFLLSG